MYTYFLNEDCLEKSEITSIRVILKKEFEKKKNKEG